MHCQSRATLRSVVSKSHTSNTCSRVCQCSCTVGLDRQTPGPRFSHRPSPYTGNLEEFIGGSASKSRGTSGSRAASWMSLSSNFLVASFSSSFDSGFVSSHACRQLLGPCCPLLCQTLFDKLSRLLADLVIRPRTPSTYQSWCCLHDHRSVSSCTSCTGFGVSVLTKLLLPSLPRPLRSSRRSTVCRRAHNTRQASDVRRSYSELDTQCRHLPLWRPCLL